MKKKKRNNNSCLACTGILRIGRSGCTVKCQGGPYPEVRVSRKNSNQAENGDRVDVKIVKHAPSGRRPKGEITKVYTSDENYMIQLRNFLRQYRIKESFPKKVRKESDSFLREFDISSEIKKRRDLRNIRTFTIDPDDARDYDDAVSIEILENGNYLLGVHIADVSAFVSPGSAIDKEAYIRGTSIYLPWKVVPMLPEVLSNDLCSLKEGKDRLSFSCFLEMNSGGNTVSSEICKSVIRSSARLTYKIAQNMIDDNSDQSEIASDLRTLKKLASAVRKKRSTSGSIDFNLPESKITVDKDNEPVKIEQYPVYETNRIVEDCMLAANRAVAELASCKGLPFIYRIHPEPCTEDAAQVMEYAGALGIKTGGYKGASTYKKIVDCIKGTKEETVLNKLILLSMQKAEYSSRNIGHFGLAFKKYTHFTSPIRRYPDLMVHRILGAWLNGKVKPDVLGPDTLPAISLKTSEAEYRADRLERSGNKLMMARFMESRIGQKFTGKISGMLEYGMFVVLNDYFVEGFVRAADIEDDYYVFDPVSIEMKGTSGGRKFTLGQEIRLICKSASVNTMTIDFVPDE
ncbi:MAG: ribonuclease R family protein [Fibrobacterota bacterium]